MSHRITVLPFQQNIEAAAGENLLQVLREAGLAPDAPCGGEGRCGKCRVLADGREVLACRTTVSGDLTVTLPHSVAQNMLTDEISLPAELSLPEATAALAFDIGTTTVVGYLLEGGTGQELVCESTENPQTAFGADVISRIRHGLSGQMEALTRSIRQCMQTLALRLCEKAHLNPAQITVISVVGNPAMQQFFMGIRPDNLAQLPFTPVLKQAQIEKAEQYFPGFANAALLIVPDISAFVGADTVAGVLATGMDQDDALTLLVDIGTNGEMVLGSKHRMIACSTAAGPALEGANIQFGMRAQQGAIDHVWLEEGALRCSVIGGGKAQGICGSGLVDALAAALQAGWINERGRILAESRRIPLTDGVYLTQEDVRQVQMAKGAIAAGITLMADHLGVALTEINRVYLAGAFGTCLRPEAACRIGLLPDALQGKIRPVGNAAGSGAKMLALDRQCLSRAQQLTEQVEHLDLAAVPGFDRCFANHMRFVGEEAFWLSRALALGFSDGAVLKISTLQLREDVRGMCAADKCGAYGKNWTCPPHCGSLAECAERIRGYSGGILLQTVGTLQKTIDTAAYRRTERLHLEHFHQLADWIRADHPEALCLGSSGCRICRECAYPQPCRFPERACASMEGYGLFVTQVCRDNGLQYYHGDKTITYTACILF